MLFLKKAWWDRRSDGVNPIAHILYDRLRLVKTKTVLFGL